MACEDVNVVLIHINVNVVLIYINVFAKAKTDQYTTRSTLKPIPTLPR